MSVIIGNVDRTVTGWFANDYVNAAVAVLLIVYSAYGATRLPPYLLRLFDMPLFKMLVFFLIVYLARKSPTIAIIAAVAFMVTLQSLTKLKIDEAVLESAKSHKENMESLPEHNQEMIQEMRQEMVMQEMPQHEIQQDSVSNIQHETKVVDGGECVQQLQYRNSFYPEYTNNNSQDVYNAPNARFAGQDVGGYDPDANYASI